MDPLEYHKNLKGKIEITSRASISSRNDLSLAYTPGVAEPCVEIAKDCEKVYDYTRKGNMVAVVTDGSAVLGLGNIGAEASLPVMEGKAVLFKEFADVDAFPIALNTQDTEEIIETVKRISPMFGGINLEDIAAPRCFEIEERLQEELAIPVFHDDQHGTAIVVLAGLMNALKLVNKELSSVRIVISGAGAAGTAITKLLIAAGAKNILVLDSKGILVKGRDHLNPVKEELALLTNSEGEHGDLAVAMKNTDIFIGVSRGGLLNKDHVASMAKDAIVFALANPEPEIMPQDAIDAGAAVVASGRSDFPNQINNVLVFPGIFRGLLDARMRKVTTEVKLAAASAIAGAVNEVSFDNIIPDPFDTRIPQLVAESVKKLT